MAFHWTFVFLDPWTIVNKDDPPILERALPGLPWHSGFSQCSVISVPHFAKGTCYSFPGQNLCSPRHVFSWHPFSLESFNLSLMLLSPGLQFHMSNCLLQISAWDSKWRRVMWDLCGQIKGAKPNLSPFPKNYFVAVGWILEPLHHSDCICPIPVEVGDVLTYPKPLLCHGCYR